VADSIPVLPYELAIGLRYTRASAATTHLLHLHDLDGGHRPRVMALIVVLSVMNGFQEELRDRILGVARTWKSAARTDSWRLAEAGAAGGEAPGSARMAPISPARPCWRGERNQGGAGARPLPEEEAGGGVRQPHAQWPLTDLKAGEFGIVLGADLARSLGHSRATRCGHRAPGRVTPAGMLPRIKQFTVVGIFRMGMFEYDAGLALIHLQDAQKLYRLDDNVSGLRVKLADMDRAPWVLRELAKTLHGDYILSTGP